MTGMTVDLARLGHRIKRVQDRHHRGANATLADLGISIGQWNALRHLHENPGASLHDLAQLTFQSDQAFGALAGRMVDRGLIERAQGPGRIVHHHLTAEGERVRRAGDERLEQLMNRSFAALSDRELVQLDRLLEKLIADQQP